MEGPRGTKYGKGAVAEHYKDVKRADPKKFKEERSKLKHSAKLKKMAKKVVYKGKQAWRNGSGTEIRGGKRNISSL